MSNQDNPKLNWENKNLSEEWRKFEEHIELMFIGPLKRASAQEQAAYIRLWIGEKGRDIFRSWNLSAEDSKNPEVILQAFREYCAPKKNTVFARFVFQERRQKDGETFENFVTDLRNMVKECEYLEPDNMVRDKIVSGIRSKEIRHLLLTEGDKLTMSKTIEIANSYEITQQCLKEMTHEDPCQAQAQIDEIRRRKQNFGNQQRTSAKMINNCRFCGSRHAPRNCPAYGQTCHICQGKNHFAKSYMCPGRQRNRSVNLLDEDEDEDIGKKSIKSVTKSNNDEDEMYIFSIETERKVEFKNDDSDEDKHIFSLEDKQMDTVYATLDIGKDDKLKFKIDTGAQVNVIPAIIFDKLKNPPPLHKSKHRLVSYTGQHLTVNGSVTLKCGYRDKLINDEFIIAEGCQTQPILSLRTSLALNLIQLTLSVEKPSTALTKEVVIEEYSTVFKGFGNLDGEVSIQLKENAVPKIHPPRRVPYALKDKVKEELDKMEKLGVIEKVTEPTDWVNSLVIAEKPNGKLRLCLDPKDLNEAIKRPHYSTKTLEEALAEMPKAKYFSKLDAQSGYWQLKLDNRSSYLTTFNTPHGRYKFNRLPFGLVCAQDYFQMQMDHIFEGITGVTPLVDDILISGETREEHDKNLRTALKRAQERKLKLNPDKLTVGVQEVEYFGHLVTSEGLKPDPAKVKAIIEMPAPKNKKELSTILGMITYLSKFAPSLSEETKPMRDVLKDDVEFSWDKPQQDAYERTKRLISDTPVLTYFDPKKELILEVDASKHGLGAAIYNDGRPIAFASKALNTTEQNYAQIEKELYAILFGCTRFHQYIYGRKVKVHSDHKPLEAIMKKSLSAAPPRLQRMLLQLQKYDISVTHVSGKNIPVSDALSRKHLSTLDNMSEEFEASVHSIMTNLPVTDEKMNFIKEKTKEDFQMDCLHNYIQNGWPDKRDECHPHALEYWNFRDELAVIDNVILKGERIVIPKSARPSLLKNLHEGHIGIEKSIQRARSAIFWPGITNDIKELISTCPICVTHQPSQCKEPLLSHDIPTRPWQKVGTDLFTWNNRQFLVTVDYYSRYFEIDELSSTTSNAIIKRLCHHFARHGIPQTLISDNGPQYVSDEFHQFTKSWDFEHKTSSPMHSQSNGLAEKTVQTAKRLLAKAKETGTNFERMLLHYRSTPVDNLASPAQLLMGRQIRSTMPATTNHLKPKIIEPEKVQETRQLMQRRQQKYYNQHTRKESQELKPGQPVQIQLNSGSKWEKGEVVKKDSTPRSYHVKVNNGIYRRNTKYIKEDKRLAYQNTSNRRKDNKYEKCQDEINKGANIQADKGKTNYTQNQNHTQINEDDIKNAPKLISNNGHGSRIHYSSKVNPNRYGRMIRRPDKLNL